MTEILFGILIGLLIGKRIFRPKDDCEHEWSEWEADDASASAWKDRRSCSACKRRERRSVVGEEKDKPAW